MILSLTFLDFPPLPNERRHWAEKARDNRQWRGDAYLVARQALRDAEYPSDFPLRSATVELVVIRPDAHWPDDDNAIAAIKPILDGMTDALVWKDDRVISGGIVVHHEKGPKGLRVDIRFGRAA